MYTFQPLADIPVDHKGFVVICVLALIVLLIAFWEDPRSFFVWFFIMSIPTVIAYGVSYHWCDQTTKVFKNEQVVATFVKYESEGYRERSGKTYVDKHFTYVVYKTPEGNVMLPCVTGSAYPERVVLYKN